MQPLHGQRPANKNGGMLITLDNLYLTITKRRTRRRFVIGAKDNSECN